ncbi:MAG TPA: cell division protein FtsQ/DivIB [Ideonella sp.]|uniref:cell division protein FtsQ/DivIB n=1 Tax=Ideonella sp. TaxID=1929293 RepID=UPI002BBC321B|nr:cell division protein FtsQ/DivIB [Ideonella sp.]
MKAAKLPADIRMMNTTSTLVFVVAGCVLLAAAALWLARQPQFAIRSIKLEGDVSRNNLNTIRANAAPRLAGSFFTLDLQAARHAFESVPWVRHAVVRRVWPDRLVVQMEEHHAVAILKDESGNDRLVNSYGEVFEANVGDVEDDRLPEFDGSDEAAPALLAMYKRLLPLLRPLEATPVRLSLSERGSWLAELDTGPVLEMGRGSEAEVAQRVQRLVSTVSGVASARQQTWTYADLRHTDGYALRLKGSPSAATLAASAAARLANNVAMSASATH